MPLTVTSKVSASEIIMQWKTAKSLGLVLALSAWSLFVFFLLPQVLERSCWCGLYLKPVNTGSEAYSNP
jgi:hypothetical protein